MSERPDYNEEIARHSPEEGTPIVTDQEAFLNVVDQLDNLSDGEILKLNHDLHERWGLTPNDAEEDSPHAALREKLDAVMAERGLAGKTNESTELSVDQQEDVDGLVEDIQRDRAAEARNRLEDAA